MTVFDYALFYANLKERGMIMKRVILTSILAILAWLSYINIFSWSAKILTIAILVKLFMSVLALVLSGIVQVLIIKTASGILLKDKIEELGDIGSVFTQTTKMLLILFIFYCLYKCQNINLLWIYASSILIDNFISYYWIYFNNKINNA